VGKGSPAEQAGIATGDRIDGMEFEPLIGRLNAGPGEQVSFAVDRGGARRDVTLVLRDYL
jgi:C-terminal processing protease CtpA/Prc